MGKKTTPKKNDAKSKKASASKKIETKNTAAENNNKKVVMKELIFRKFQPISKQPVPRPTPMNENIVPPAPEIIASDNPQEKKRLRALLMKKFSMDDIKSAAKAPEKTAAENNKTKEPVANAKVLTETLLDDPLKSSAMVSQPVSPEASSIPQEPSLDTTIPETDPIQKALKYGAVALVVLLLLLVGASFKNSSKYYIVKKEDAVEIWRGRFSPIGKQRLILLPGVNAPENNRTVYSRNHVFPLAFNYYLEKADALLNTRDIPNYIGIREYLRKAKAFAINNEMKNDITARLNNIDFITLFYKIDIFLRKGNPKSLDQAAQLIKKAGKLTTNSTQFELLKAKAAEIKERRAAITEAKSKASETKTSKTGTEK